MEDMKAEKQDDICVLRMSRARANAINGTMLAELDTLIDEAANDDTIRGLVLASDHPRVFSAGIDLHEVSQYDRETMGMFFVRFIDLYESLYLLPKPVVAAISGHSATGGDRHALDQFLEHWFSAEAEAGRQTLLASLAEKSQR